jgi:hypothetical protein
LVKQLLLVHNDAAKLGYSLPKGEERCFEETKV